MGLNPAFVDFNCERPDQAQSAFLVGEDANDMGAALKFLINAFEHIGALEMLVVLSGQPVKGESFLDVLFDPGAKLGGIFPAIVVAKRSDLYGLRRHRADRRANVIPLGSRRRLCGEDSRARCDGQPGEFHQLERLSSRAGSGPRLHTLI